MTIPAFGRFAAAQDADRPMPAANESIETPRKPHIARKISKPVKTVSAAAAPEPLRPLTASTQPAKGKDTASFDFTAQLEKAGASACRGQINASATSTMGSVVKFNTVSNWSRVAGDKRAISLAIGQKYADGSAVPFSVSQVIAAPNQQGSCDSFIVQVFPSPLPCAELRDRIAAAHGQQIGDLAGIPLMQDGTKRTMLVPTAANTCVLVATSSVYER